MSEGPVVSQDKRQDGTEAHNFAQHKIVILMAHMIGPAQGTGMRHESLLPPSAADKDGAFCGTIYISSSSSSLKWLSKIREHHQSAFLLG